MTRWTDMTAAEIAKVSARNRASRTHKLGDTVQDSRDDTHLAKPTQNARHGDPGKESRQVQARSSPRKRRKQVYRPPAMRESAVLDACKGILEAHPQVALWWRQNTGGMHPTEERWVKFGFTGAPDLMGVMVGGRFLAVECKASGRKATAAQQSFLDNVLDAGGLAVCVDHQDKMLAYLNGRE